MEIWSPVPGYEGIYEASDLGRVRGLVAKKGRVPGRILKGVPAGPTRSYLYVGLYGGAGRSSNKRRSIHRIVMAAFHGPSDLHVNHINGNTFDNRLCNLEYCTPQQNTAHAWRTGLLPAPPPSPLGEDHPSATISEETAKRIIRMGADGLKPAVISRAVSASVDTVSMILRGRTWRHLPRAGAEHPLASS